MRKLLKIFSRIWWLVIERFLCFFPLIVPFLMHLQAYQRLQLQQQMLQAQRNVSGPMRQQEQQVGQTCLSLSSSVWKLECWLWLPTATIVWFGSVIALGANHLFSVKWSCDPISLTCQVENKLVINDEQDEHFADRDLPQLPLYKSMLGSASYLHNYWYRG